MPTPQGRYALPEPSPSSVPLCRTLQGSCRALTSTLQHHCLEAGSEVPQGGTELVPGPVPNGSRATIPSARDQLWTMPHAPQRRPPCGEEPLIPRIDTHRLHTGSPPCLCSTSLPPCHRHCSPALVSEPGCQRSDRVAMTLSLHCIFKGSPSTAAPAQAIMLRGSTTIPHAPLFLPQVGAEGHPPSLCLAGLSMGVPSK